MLTGKLEKAINGQINAEIYSAYLYLSMSANFAAQNWPGAAKWMRVQNEEETKHAMRFYDFVLACNSKVVLTEIAKPQTEWPTPLATFEATYAHEQKVTALINALVTLAHAEQDHATANFLQWFVKEQVEEEENALHIVQQLRQIGDSKTALFMLDQQLGKRV